MGRGFLCGRIVRRKLIEPIVCRPLSVVRLIETEEHHRRTKNTDTIEMFFLPIRLGTGRAADGDFVIEQVFRGN